MLVRLVPLLAASAVIGTGAALQDVPSCDQPSVDGRSLGHLPYDVADQATLTPAPYGVSVGQTCLVARVVLPDLEALLAAARADPTVRGRIVAVSCFRSPARQAQVFHASRRAACARVLNRARYVGPPGYSEHATGYALDFGMRPSRRCADLQPCFADTDAGAWLRANAPRYGFELSFPRSNAQGVAYEPWHWRWVGTRIDVPGAAAARLTFARARAQFPSDRAVPDEPAVGVARLPGTDQDTGGEH